MVLMYGIVFIFLGAFILLTICLISHDIYRSIKEVNLKRKKYKTSVFCLDCGGPCYLSDVNHGKSLSGHHNVIPVYTCKDCNHKNYFWCEKQYIMT